MSRILDRAYVVVGFGLSMFLLPLVGRGQETSQDSQAPTQQTSSPPVLPAPLGGFSPTLILSETPTAKVLSGGIAINGVFSDNSFTANPLGSSDQRYSIVPSLGFSSAGPKTQSTLNYAGGLSLDPQLAGNTQQTHTVNADLRQAITRRLLVEIRQDYSMTNNLFPGTRR